MTPVEIIDDPAYPDGGHVLIRFAGAPPFDGATILSVEPLTDGYDYKGPRQVEAMAESVPDGVRLSVGNGQLDQLETGIAVLLTVPDAGLSAEALWPDVRPLRVASRRAPIRGAAPRRVVDAGASSARSPSTTAGPTQPPGAPRSSSAPTAPPPSAGPGPARTAPPATDRSAVETRSPTPAPPPPATPPSRVPAEPQTPEQRRPPPAAPPTTVGRTGQDAAHATGEMHGAAPSVEEDRSRTVPTTPSMSTGSVQGAAARAEAVPVRRTSTALVAVAASLIAFIVGGAAGGVVMMRRAPPAAQAPVAASLYDTLATGDVSPLGTPASAVKPENLFDQGSSFLRGANGLQANPIEGAYWLKRAVAAAPDDTGQRRPWALMRLGLMAYSGKAAADHAAGRDLLEVAAAWDNAFALCKLGEIAEKGDDVSDPDPHAAVQWYERAKKAGCKEADEGLARLKR